jgi:L-iditol 2-dehydrogenase
MSAPPTSVRAAVLERYNDPLQIRELPVPELEPGSLLLKMHVATVCGSDSHFWQGHFAGVLPIDLPSVPGHEGVGEVVAFGAGARVDSVGAPLKEGDRVLWTHAACGHCHYCSVEREPTLCTNLFIGYFENCTRPPYIAGTFTEYAYVKPAAGRVRVPDEVTSEWASAASCALRTVVHSFSRLGAIGSNDTVVVQGVGAVGLFAVAMAATRSPRRLIAIGDPADRLELAGSFGADTLISVSEHPDPDERVELVREATDGRGASIVMEMSGAPGAFVEGVSMTARNGRYLVVGTLGGAPQPVLPQLITTRGLHIIGSFSGQVDAYYHALDFMAQHRDTFNWDAISGNRYGLADATKALEAVRAGTEIKPLVIPSD